MSCISKPERRYMWRSFLTMAVYLIVGKCVNLYFHRAHPGGTFAVALASLTALPIIANIAVAGLYIKEQQDEFIRMVYIRSVLMGIGVTLAVTTIVGNLQLFHIVHDFPLYAVFAIFWVMTGVAIAGNNLYYYRGRNA
jgi:hypothetical protein